MKTFLMTALLVTLILGFNMVSNAEVIDKDTIAYYSFNQLEGGKVVDESGNNDPAELFGDASLTGANDGISGKAMEVDGDGDYIRLGNIGAPDEGTIEVWIKYRNFQAHADGDGIVGIGNEYGGTGDVGLMGGHQGQGASKIIFGFYQGGWKWAVADTEVEANLLNEWHHVAGTWGKNGIELWIDGEKKAEFKDYKAGIPKVDYATMLVGSNSWRGDLNALIDEFRLSKTQRGPDTFLYPEKAFPVQPKDKSTTTWGRIKTAYLD